MPGSMSRRVHGSVWSMRVANARQFTGRKYVRHSLFVKMCIQHHDAIDNKSTDRKVRQDLKWQACLGALATFLDVPDLALNFVNVFILSTNVHFNEVE